MITAKLGRRAYSAGLKVMHFVRFSVNATGHSIRADDDASGFFYSFMIAFAQARQSAAEIFLLVNVHPAHGFKGPDGIFRALIHPFPRGGWSDAGAARVPGGPIIVKFGREGVAMSFGSGSKHKRFPFGFEVADRLLDLVRGDCPFLEGNEIPGPISYPPLR